VTFDKNKFYKTLRKLLANSIYIIQKTALHIYIFS